MSTETLVQGTSATPQGTPAIIKISQIMRPPENVRTLRPVHKDTVEYKGLLDNIRKRGIRQPIEVRELGQTNDQGEPVYGLVDGNNRLTCAEDLALDSIPALITNVEDADLLEAQMLNNLHKIDMKPMEYTEAIITILHRNPLLTKKELAERLDATEEFIEGRLSLLALTPEIQQLVNEGKLVLQSAFALTKLPKEMQPNHVQQAMDMTGEKFTQYMFGIIQELKAARAAGRKPKVDHYIPSAYLQKLPIIEEELKNPTNVLALVQAKNLTETSAIVAETLKWVLHLDDASIKEDSDKWEEAKKKREEDAKKRKEEAKAKKDEESKKLAEKATLSDLTKVQG